VFGACDILSAICSCWILISLCSNVRRVFLFDHESYKHYPGLTTKQRRFSRVLGSNTEQIRKQEQFKIDTVSQYKSTLLKVCDSQIHNSFPLACKWHTECHHLLLFPFDNSRERVQLYKALRDTYWAQT
jgi:hypothetical protein